MSGDPDDPAFIALAAAISDGAPVDWAEVEKKADTPDEKQLVQNLRELERFVAAQRSTESSDPLPAAAAEPSAGPQSWRHLVLFEPIGEGAFGTVYRGWDPQLEREVAVKLLSTSSARTGSPLAEARNLARIRHSNVVTIYGADRVEEQVGIWMEFVDGKTLAAMIHELGPMSAREVTGIGVDLCRALSALHASGLLHRDVKAHNVMREVGGRIVLMDFSGAQALTPDEVATDLSGTPLYMAPELFEGAAASIASDVYSLGVLLFFLLTATVPVHAPGVRELKSAHARRAKKRLRDVRPDLPEAVVQVIERATAHDSSERYQTMGELELALATAGPHPAFVQAHESGKPQGGPLVIARRVAAWIGLAALLALVAAAGLFAKRRPPADAAVARFEVGPPFLSGSWPRLSPDGRQIVFGTVVEGRNRFWLRPIDSIEGRPLMNTVANETPFWSPDSRTLAFFADGKLKTVAVDGGEPETIAPAPHPRGGDWSGNWIIFVGDNGAVAKVAPNGTGLSMVTTLDKSRGDYQNGWPRFLPDGRRFLYMVRSSNADRTGIYVGSLDGSPPVRLMPAYSRVAYGGGYLVFVREGALLAQPFDTATATLRGEPVTLAARVKGHAAGDAAFDVASSGVLIYGLDSGQPTSRLMVYDRRGREVQALTTPGFYRQPRLSPDGQRVVVEKSDPATNNSDLWIYGIGRENAVRLTSSDAPDVKPVWSPDGTRVAFSSRRGPEYRVFVKRVDGIEPEKPLIESSGDTFVEHWSRNGYLIATVLRNGLWVLPLNPAEKPWAVRENTSAGTWQAEFSPDGRWLAYVSEESGAAEVYVEPFPANGSRWQVSAQGGTEPHWAQNGKELFYISASSTLMLVTDGATSGWQNARATPLFRIAIPDLFGNEDLSVSPDGQTFVLNLFLADPVVPPIDVVLNWTSLLAK